MPLGVFTCQYAAFTPCDGLAWLCSTVYLPANMQLSHRPVSSECLFIWCIYLPICSFHTQAGATTFIKRGVFTCQYAAFTPKGNKALFTMLVYLPANMQLSHLLWKALSLRSGCIYLPICSFHTIPFGRIPENFGVFTCQYAAFTPSPQTSTTVYGVYLPANMQLSHHG